MKGAHIYHICQDHRWWRSMSSTGASLKTRPELQENHKRRHCGNWMKLMLCSKISQTSQRQSSDYKLQNTKSSLHDPPPKKNRQHPTFFGSKFVLGSKSMLLRYLDFFSGDHRWDWHTNDQTTKACSWMVIQFQMTIQSISEYEY